MQILPPWLALPKSLKRNYRYFTLDKALPAPGKLLFVQCEEGFRRVRPELTKDPRTGDTVMQFTSIDTGHPVTNPRCYYPIPEDSLQPCNEQKVS